MTNQETAAAIARAVVMTSPELPAPVAELPEMTRRQIAIEARWHRVDEQTYLDRSRKAQAEARQRAITADAIDAAVAQQLGRR